MAATVAATVDASHYSSQIKLYHITLSDDFAAGHLTPTLEQECCHVNLLKTTVLALVYFFSVSPEPDSFSRRIYNIKIFFS